MSVARSELVILDGWLWFSLKMLSITESSVVVVLVPQNAVQSLTIIPAASNSLPRFTVPATSGICNNEDNSSSSCEVVLGWITPP